MILSEAVVRRVIGAEGAEALIKITADAWKDYVDEGVTRYHRSTRANVVWDYMAKRGDDTLPDMDGVQKMERHSRPLYVLRERLVLRPKMHRETATRNYPTPAQLAVQRLGKLPEFEDYPVISFGYQLDSAEAGIEDFLVTSPADPWLINLEELANGELNPVLPMLPWMKEDLDAIEPIRFRRAQ